MDVSEKYIEMCEKAEEIQKEWKDNSGDFYVSKTDHSTQGIRHNILISTRSKKDCIWLPRQDQLQDIIKDNYTDKETNIPFLHPYNHMLWDLVDRLNQGDYCIKFGVSMEQLWLAFVMEEKYNKTWNGKDWIKDDN